MFVAIAVVIFSFFSYFSIGRTVGRTVVGCKNQRQHKIYVCIIYKTKSKANQNSLTTRCKTQFLFLHSNQDIVPQDYECIVVYLFNTVFFSSLSLSLLFFQCVLLNSSFTVECVEKLYFWVVDVDGNGIDDDNIVLYLYRPCDRNLRDAELISCRLRRVEPLCRLPGSALQQLAMCGFYEDLEKGITCEYCYLLMYLFFAIFSVLFHFAFFFCTAICSAISYDFVH